MSLDTAARCATHGEALAAEAGQRCGTFLCVACLPIDLMVPPEQSAETRALLEKAQQA